MVTRIQQRLSETLSGAEKDPSAQLRTQLDDARFVLLSDSHKGVGDGADDFAPCKPQYLAALQSYLDDDYTLIVLGDAEELWEVDKPERIFAAHADTYELERGFLHHDAGRRYYRIWGNHDNEWQDPEAVADHLHAVLPGIEVPEGMLLRFFDGDDEAGRFFLAHGHQGTLDSDALADLSEAPVFAVWGPIQRLTHLRSTRWTDQVELDDSHAKRMYYDFAIEQPSTALIVGHTHRMVVDIDGQAAAVEKGIAKFRRVLESGHFRQNPAMEQLIGRKIEYLEDRNRAALAAEEHWPGPEEPRFRPSYFNTGCCAFDNGSVSCIEIADGEVRMVSWERGEGRVERGRRRLADVLDAVG